MIEKYIALNRALRSLQATAREIIDAYNYESEGFATNSLTSIMLRLLSDLKRLWPKDVKCSKLKEIEQLIIENDIGSFWKIVDKLIPALENTIDDYFSSQPYSELNYTILDLLHPRVTAASYAHFRAGHFRDAVLNSIVAIFDLIRERTGLDKDGMELITETFSLLRPRLIFSTLDYESGRNDQKGFIQILQGVYQGVRNPKAHTLTINPSQNVAAQYLVFSSLLCRRVEEAQLFDESSINTETKI